MVSSYIEGMMIDQRRRDLYDACDILDALYQLGSDRMNMRIYDYLLNQAKRDRRGRFDTQEQPIGESQWINWIRNRKLILDCFGQDHYSR